MRLEISFGEMVAFARPFWLAVSTSTYSLATAKLFVAAYSLRSCSYAGIQKPSFSCSLEGDAGIDHRLLAGPEGRSRVSNSLFILSIKWEREQRTNSIALNGALT